MRHLINVCYHKLQSYVLKRLVQSGINATDIVMAYGGCHALIDDLVESDYEYELIDFVLESPRGHECIADAAYEANQNKY